MSGQDFPRIFGAGAVVLFAILAGLSSAPQTSVSFASSAVFGVTAVFVALSSWKTRSLPGNRSLIGAWSAVLLAFYSAAWAARPFVDTASWSDIVAPFSVLSGAWFCAPDRVKDLIDLHRWRQIADEIMDSRHG